MGINLGVLNQNINKNNKMMMMIIFRLDVYKLNVHKMIYKLKLKLINKIYYVKKIMIKLIFRFKINKNKVNYIVQMT